MPTAVISSKGQITLPARFRRKLGLEANARASIEIEGDAIVIRQAGDFFALEGFLGKALPPDVEKEGMMRGAAGRGTGRSS